MFGVDECRRKCNGHGVSGGQLSDFTNLGHSMWTVTNRYSLIPDYKLHVSRKRYAIRELIKRLLPSNQHLLLSTMFLRNMTSKIPKFTQTFQVVVSTGGGVHVNFPRLGLIFRIIPTAHECSIRSRRLFYPRSWVSGV